MSLPTRAAKSGSVRCAALAASVADARPFRHSDARPASSLIVGPKARLMSPRPAGAAFPAQTRGAARPHGLGLALPCSALGSIRPTAHEPVHQLCTELNNGGPFGKVHSAVDSTRDSVSFERGVDDFFSTRRPARESALKERQEGPKVSSTRAGAPRPARPEKNGGSSTSQPAPRPRPRRGARVSRRLTCPPSSAGDQCTWSHPPA